MWLSPTAMTLSPTNREETDGADSASLASAHRERSVVRDWMPFAILLVAAFFRFAWLDLKPPHHDEGVVASMAEGITEKGYYEYDPTNFHGPLPFYLSWLSQRLFGRTIFAMRLPVVMLSVLAVGLMLAFREYFKERAVRWAALAMAVSPTMVYYGRQCAHEMGAMFFNVLLIWGAIGLIRGGSRRELWATGLGLAGMILCKETYAIHAAAIVLAIPALWLLGKFSRAAKEAPACRDWTALDLLRVVCGSIAIVLFFYSGTLMDWSKVEGLWTTWSAWVGRGVAEDVQDKKGFYYGELLAQYEWTAILGIVAALAALMPGTRRETRFMALIALAGACGYNLVKYKTPWLVMSWAWPFYMLFGLGVVAADRHVGRRFANAAAGFVIVLMAAKSWHLNFHNYAPRGDTSPYPEAYAYVQALDDLNKITVPLNALAAMDPVNKHIPGAMIGGEQYPLPWLLGEFGRFGWYGRNAEGKISLPDTWNLDFIQAHVDVVPEVEKHLSEAYFREDFQIRNMGGDRSVLYFRASVFAPVFPNRVPEFIPMSESQPAK
jgi:uncharacterized protein (TIGR03663 family)